jgi:hypothetical protein
MPAIPESRSQREKAISLCGGHCSGLSSPPSPELFSRPAESTLCDEISSFVVYQPEFGETWCKLSHESRTMLGTHRRGFDWKDIAEVLRLTAVVRAAF